MPSNAILSNTLPVVWSCPKYEFELSLQEGKTYVADKANMEMGDIGFFHVGTFFYLLDEEKIVVFYDKRLYGEDIRPHTKDLFSQGLAKYFDEKDSPQKKIKDFLNNMDLMQLGMLFDKESIEESCLDAWRRLQSQKVKDKIVDALGDDKTPQNPSHEDGRDKPHLM